MFRIAHGEDTGQVEVRAALRRLAPVGTPVALPKSRPRELGDSSRLTPGSARWYRVLP